MVTTGNFFEGTNVAIQIGPDMFKEKVEPTWDETILGLSNGFELGQAGEKYLCRMSGSRVSQPRFSRAQYKIQIHQNIKTE